MESRIQPDSFFGASGGQRIDTANSEMTSTGGSSMAYSPSQLDAGGDVDPVAEADVYLAYGRDLQAEEILKEAIRHNPGTGFRPRQAGRNLRQAPDRKARKQWQATCSSSPRVRALTGTAWPNWAEPGPENAFTNLADAPAAIWPSVHRPAGFGARCRPADGCQVRLRLPPDPGLDLDLDLPDDALTDAPPPVGSPQRRPPASRSADGTAELDDEAKRSALWLNSSNTRPTGRRR